MKTLTLDPKQLEENATAAASFLKSLANEHRLMVLCQLVDGERGVGELLAGSTLSQSALSQHLSKLREQGLVETRRQGQSIFYSISDPAVAKLMMTLADIFCPED